MKRLNESPPLFNEQQQLTSQMSPLLKKSFTFDNKNIKMQTKNFFNIISKSNNLERDKFNVRSLNTSIKLYETNYQNENSTSNNLIFTNCANQKNLNNQKEFKTNFDKNTATTTLTTGTIELNGKTSPTYFNNRRQKNNIKRQFLFNICGCFNNLKIVKWITNKLDVEDRAKRADYISSNIFF